MAKNAADKAMKLSLQCTSVPQEATAMYTLLASVFCSLCPTKDLPELRFNQREDKVF
jgi:hypothetical protein